jgi:ATP-dependent DNA helicase RecQ
MGLDGAMDGQVARALGSTAGIDTPDDALAAREAAEGVLRRLAGEHACLRDDQWRAISALAHERRRVLVVQRTGWGKSAVYFVATALLRAAGAGPTVIVSPLLALMRNQVEAAARAGIHARTLNSSNVWEWEQITAEIEAGTVDVLLVSPERLNNPAFRDDVLPRLAASAGLVVVDEAHCVSDWGHDFRPDYRRLRTLLAELKPGVPVLATTATANARVTADVAEQLDDQVGEGTLVLRGSLDRDSLSLAVVRLPSPAHRLGWLDERLRELSGSGIIYTLTVAAAEDVARFLGERGHRVLAYSGRSDDAERRAAEEALLRNEVKALVATSALGMGFDKPDLRFVVHLGAPQSPIAYYQQIGRAGRSVDQADVVLLPGEEDEAIWRYFAGLAFPPEDQVRRTLDVLAGANTPLSTAALEPRVELRRGRLEMMLKVLDVDGAVLRVRGGWQTTGVPWRYDAERYQRIAAERTAEQQAMRDYISGVGCRMEYLRQALDDPAAEPCGRCDNCRGRPLPAEVGAEALEAAQRALDQPGVELAPRLLWPTGMEAAGISLRGRIPAGEAAAPGRALGRLSDIGWGARLREVLAEPAANSPVPDDVFAAALRVLAAWPWEQRPVGVVIIPSRSRQRLVSSLGERLAQAGRLPLLGTVERVDVAAARASGGNSAQRLRAVHDAFVVPPTLAAGIADRSGPLLLVDDQVDSGWTMTVVARALRIAGAEAVLPFALALVG